MYGQQPGFGQPPAGAAPYAYDPMPTPQERQWAMIAHLGTLVVGFWAPLILMFVDITGQPSAFVKHHAKQALIWALAGTVGTIITCGVWIIPMMIFQVIAGLEANKGAWYTYPGLRSFAGS